MTAPPSLSEGLNPPLYFHANKTHFHMKSFAKSFVRVFEGLNPPLYFHANKTHFHMKSFAKSFVRVFGIRKWPIMRRKRREI